MKLQIILGNQLFPLNFYDKNSQIYFMCEDINLCTHYKYHKHKIIFFLSSMRKYATKLEEHAKDVYYYKISKKAHYFVQLKKVCKKLKVKQIQVFEIEDKFFESLVQSFCSEHKIELIIKKSPMFLVSREEFKKYNDSAKKPFMKQFYEGLRKSTGILMKNGSPEGGKYSFDGENRKKIPKKFEVIQNKIPVIEDDIVNEVKKIVEEFFADHPGSVDNFWMATTRAEALKILDDFIKRKIELFGDFEDALDHRDPFLYHSVLSPYLNIGFLTPEEVIKKIIKAKSPLNSKEGFVRQVIGWREFVRGIYQEYSEVQESRNFFNHHKKLSKHWYDGTTGITPLDDAIKKVITFGYNHHIERLMVISNLMLLCEVDPHEVHKWFMEMYVDSSDWVMGPNVYGMAQFSDGGIFATKPYISGSNYIFKMGHYKKSDWCDVWDGLYWQFIDKNRDFFAKNYRMSMMVKMFDKMDSDKKARIFEASDLFKKEMTY
jgi:deoxyribodipyrimidine photolyase-related protein